MKIFIVVPAHNEEKRIGKVLKELSKTGYKTIVVDDGSSDNTKKKAEKYADYVLRHKVNLGKGAAMKTGADAAVTLGADAIVFMDSDGQHKTENLDGFINAIGNGYDIVYGSRNFNMQVPLMRYIGNKSASLLVKLLFGVYVSDILCGYRALTMEAYKKIKWDSSSYGVETEMIIRAANCNLKHCEVPVTTVYYDSVKGVTIFDAISIFFDVIRWRITL